MSTRTGRSLTLGVSAMCCTVLLAGCGSGFKYNDAVGRVPPPGTEAPLIARGAGPSPPDTGTGAVAPIPSRPPVTGGPGAAVTSAFCRDMANLQGLVGALLQLPAGGAAATAARARALVQNLKRDAPPALGPAVAVLVQIQDRVIGDISASPIDVADLAAALADPGYRQALQQVVLYAAQHCSINLTPPSLSP